MSIKVRRTRLGITFAKGLISSLDQFSSPMRYIPQATKPCFSFEIDTACHIVQKTVAWVSWCSGEKLMVQYSAQKATRRGCLRVMQAS